MTKDEEWRAWWAVRGLDVDTMSFLAWFMALRALRIEIMVSETAINRHELAVLQTLPPDVSPREAYERTQAVNTSLRATTEVLHDAFHWLSRFARKFNAR